MQTHDFIEFTEPVFVGCQDSWFLGSVESNSAGEYWYLHNDGTVHDFCRDAKLRSKSTGWFDTENDALVARYDYCDKHRMLSGQVHDPIQSGTIESEVMVF